MENMVFAGAWLLSVLIVFMFSWDYFNGAEYHLEDSGTLSNGDQGVQKFIMPTFPRYMISKRQYNSWFAVFLFFTFLLFGVVVSILLKAEAASFKEANIPTFYAAYPQLMAALLISGFLPGLPGKADILNHLRSFTQRRAQIPERAASIYRNIKSFSLNISAADRQAATAWVGGEYLDDSDFDQRPGSAERNWAHTCYLMTKVAELTRDPNSVYSRNLNKPELAYGNVQRNFEIVKEDVKRFKDTADKSVSEPFIRHQTRLLFSQAAQLMVCLVFCSEARDADADNRFRALGVPMRPIYEFNIQIELLMAMMAAFVLVVFIASIVIGLILHRLGLGGISGLGAFKVAVAALIVIHGPIAAVFIFKDTFSGYWPVRGYFSERQIGPIIAMFFLGGGLGVAGFYLIDYINLFGFNAGWERMCLPYVLISAFAGLLTAAAIDRRRRVWKMRPAIGRALAWGAIEGVVFMLCAGMAIVCGLDVAADEFGSFFRQHAFIILIAGVVGFMTGAFVSLISEFTVRLQGGVDLLTLNLSQYVVPALERKNIRNLDADSLNQVFSDRQAHLPEKLVGYLKEMHFLSEEGRLTTTSVQALKMLVG